MVIILFRFVYPNRSEIERGEIEQVMVLIRKDFNSFAGRKFEKICLQTMIEMNKKKTLAFHFKIIGGKVRNSLSGSITKEKSIILSFPNLVLQNLRRVCKATRILKV